MGEFRRIARFRWSELGIALITTVAVVVLGVLYGVIAAVAADAGPEPGRWFVLNAEANVELDVTAAAAALQSLVTELRRRGMVSRPRGSSRTCAT